MKISVFSMFFQPPWGIYIWNTVEFYHLSAGIWKTSINQLHIMHFILQSNFSHLYLDLLVLTNAADDIGVDTNNADTYLVFQFIQYMWLKTFQLYRPIERDWARGWAVKKTYMETPLFSTRCSLDDQNLRIILF